MAAIVLVFLLIPIAGYLCANSQIIWVPNPGISIPTAHKELKIQESRHQPPQLPPPYCN